MNLVHPEIESYCETMSSGHSADCAAIYDYTVKHRDDAQMLIGPLQANFLGMIARMTGAERILEIGCYTGYSALAMAEHLPAHGEVVTIDMDEEVARIAQDFWKRSEEGGKITLHVGTALEVLKTLDGPFEMVFLDADKYNNINYLNMTLPLLSERGVIVVDNTLWYGTVLDPSDNEPDARGTREFNEYVSAREDLLVSLVPLRDGVTLIQKQ